MDTEIVKIEDSFRNSFIHESFKDIALDITESAIDNLIENDIIKEIPIIKTIYAIGKTVLGIKQNAFARKIIKYLFLTDTIAKTDLANFMEDLDSKTEKRSAEVLLHLLDNYDNDKKVEVLANLTRAKIKGEIDIETFLRLATIIKDSFYYDLCSLNNYKNDVKSFGMSTESLMRQNLVYLSIVDFNNNRYKLTMTGNALLLFGLNK